MFKKAFRKGCFFCKWLRLFIHTEINLQLSIFDQKSRTFFDYKSPLELVS
jgi:hypothetical protein